MKLILFAAMDLCASGTAQTVLSDFDNAPIHTSLPIAFAAGGVTALIGSLAGTGWFS